MELNNTHVDILRELQAKEVYALANPAQTPRIGKAWYKGLETEIAHLLECGYIDSQTEKRETSYSITRKGISVLQVVTDPEYLLRAEIARLESELTAARARLARPDSLHEGG